MAPPAESGKYDGEAAGQSPRVRGGRRCIFRRNQPHRLRGRALTRTANSLRIRGEAARIMVRWRFGAVAGATVNGAAASVQSGADGPYIEFDHTAESVVARQQGQPRRRAYPRRRLLRGCAWRRNRTWRLAPVWPACAAAGEAVAPASAGESSAGASGSAGRSSVHRVNPPHDPAQQPFHDLQEKVLLRRQRRKRRSAKRSRSARSC